MFGYSIFSYVNSVLTEVQTLQNIQSLNVINELRYPSVGWEGTAHSLFGVERELVEIVAPTEVTTATAAAKLAAIKDVRISAEVPVEGAMLEQYLNLQSKVRVTHPSQFTGLSSFSANLTSYRYEFGSRGKNYLGIDTDVAALVRVV
jgi:hypothetical protein